MSSQASLSVRPKLISYQEAWQVRLRWQVSEMIELYEAKGMSREDATEVISRLAKYRSSVG